MTAVHGNIEDEELIDTLVQVVFSSHLRAFFKVSKPGPEPLMQDEGLVALRAFRSEFDEIETQDVPLSLGIDSQSTETKVELLFQRTIGCDLHGCPIVIGIFSSTE
jgi:activator of 2-hydroxyglutaryl-CoA dehydratase